MQSLTATLTAAQKDYGSPRLLKVVLTRTGYTTYTYDLTEPTRLFAVVHPEAPYSQQALISLSNYDKALTNIDFKGYTATISYGMHTSAGDEYSPTAPLTVLAQQYLSNRGKLTCVLTALGIPNLMDMDKASAAYTPESTDTKTVKTILTEIIQGLTGSGAVFSHTTAYTVSFDSEDSLINTFIPADAFRIAKNSSRLGVIKTLIKMTKCVFLVKSDGQAHIFVPTTA